MRRNLRRVFKNRVLVAFRDRMLDKAVIIGSRRSSATDIASSSRSVKDGSLRSMAGLFFLTPLMPGPSDPPTRASSRATHVDKK